jgi:hypothetical protein
MDRLKRITAGEKTQRPMQIGCKINTYIRTLKVALKRHKGKFTGPSNVIPEMKPAFLIFGQRRLNNTSES